MQPCASLRDKGIDARGLAGLPGRPPGFGQQHPFQVDTDGRLSGTSTTFPLDMEGHGGGLHHGREGEVVTNNNRTMDSLTSFFSSVDSLPEPIQQGCGNDNVPKRNLQRTRTPPVSTADELCFTRLLCGSQWGEERNTKSPLVPRTMDSLPELEQRPEPSSRSRQVAREPSVCRDDDSDYRSSSSRRRSQSSAVPEQPQRPLSRHRSPVTACWFSAAAGAPIAPGTASGMQGGSAAPRFGRGGELDHGSGGSHGQERPSLVDDAWRGGHQEAGAQAGQPALLAHLLQSKPEQRSPPTTLTVQRSWYASNLPVAMMQPQPHEVGARADDIEEEDFVVMQATPVIFKLGPEVLTPEMQTSISRVYPAWRQSKRLFRRPAFETTGRHSEPSRLLGEEISVGPHESL